MNAGVPLVPVLIENLSHIYHLPEKSFRAGTVNVKVLKPVETAVREVESSDEALQRLLMELSNIMLEGLKEM